MDAAKVYSPLSPAFHTGERALQAQMGVEARLAEIGPRVIRPAMPDQHRQFFAQLPFLLLASVDEQGQPWASMLGGPPGFVQSPEADLLVVAASPRSGDPLASLLQPGAPLGVLGLEPPTRRRNRANGTVSRLLQDEDGSLRGWQLQVSQSFGNCPKYIQARDVHYRAESAAVPGPLQVSRGLLPETAALVQRSDTFFIATAHPAAGKSADPSHGVDISHRGGLPGFLHLEWIAGQPWLWLPDYSGNNYFNTLGNLLLEPRAGLLLVDYATGHLHYLAVSLETMQEGATARWPGKELADVGTAAAGKEFPGAQRVLGFQVLENRLLAAALPLQWGEAQYSPVLPGL